MADVELSHLPLRAVETSSPARDTEPSQIRVVLAEDRAIARQGLCRLLEGEGDIHLVAQAADLRDASLLAEERRPRVLVLDLRMPNGSSVKTIETLRRDVPETEIVIVSVDDSPGSAHQALTAGALGFVLKELADADLAAAIRCAARGEEYVSPLLATRLGGLRVALTKGRLTARESQVLRLIALGHTNVEIARKLELSARTIETHRASIHRKLKLRTRAELVRFALRCGLLGS